MSVIVVGLSHRTASLSLLERCALSGDALPSMAARLREADHVEEAVVLATCNRLEVYAEVTKFHGGVTDVGRALGCATGVELTELRGSLYIHYEEAAVAHLFGVACGLDSMAVGEPQILGQLRTALRLARETGACGRVLGALVQQALHTGKRARSETALDHAGPSLVGAGMDAAARILGPWEDVRALVIGAGAMSALAVASLRRAGVGTVTVANRTPRNASALAGAAGVRVVSLAQLPQLLGEADLVVSATGATGYVVGARLVHERPDGAPQVFLDLALPRDIAPEVAAVPGVSLIDLDEIGRTLSASGTAQDLSAVRSIVAEEVAAHLAAQRAEAVAPTVVALRGRANAVVESELARLESRLGPVDDRVREEITRTVHRVVEKLLHTPTVRVKELASGPDGGAYAEALRELFDLDAPCTDASVVEPGRVDLSPVVGADPKPVAWPLAAPPPVPAPDVLLAPASGAPLAPAPDALRAAASGALLAPASDALRATDLPAPLASAGGVA